ncbi:hypothetical protein ACKKBF_B00675 [Auxenochlorella protothecoides x Auxenochlorella symbiontica]
MSLFDEGRDLLSKVHSADSGRIQTNRFLDVCRLVLQAVDHLGTGFMLVKSDVGGNIDRLARSAATNPERYDADILVIVEDEVQAGGAASSSSSTKGLLWLKRAMQFVTALLNRLTEDEEESLSAAASETYYATLQQYHGWIVTGTFTVALKLVPARQSFLDSIGAASPEGLARMHTFCQEFSVLLLEVHQFLSENGLDDPAKV